VETTVIEQIEQIPNAEDVLSPEEAFEAANEIVPMGQMTLEMVKCPCCCFEFIPGQEFDPVAPAKSGKKLLTRVKELMNERSRLPNGQYNYRFDDVANAIVTAMEKGYWPAIQHFIDREEGKVANRVAGADGQNLKMYIALPTEGELAP
jgi:hypothetical protein